MTYCDRQAIRSSYELLEIKSNACFDEVKEAYRDLAFVWHPDRYVSNPRLQKKAQDRFQAISNAYHLLEFCLFPGESQTAEHGSSEHKSAEYKSAEYKSAERVVSYPRSPVAQSGHTPQAHTRQSHTQQSHHHSHHPSQQHHGSYGTGNHEIGNTGNNANHQGRSADHGHRHNDQGREQDRERRINMKPQPQVEINPWLLICVMCLSGLLNSVI